VVRRSRVRVDRAHPAGAARLRACGDDRQVLGQPEDAPQRWAAHRPPGGPSSKGRSSAGCCGN